MPKWLYQLAVVGRGDRHRITDPSAARGWSLRSWLSPLLGSFRQRKQLRNSGCALTAKLFYSRHSDEMFRHSNSCLKCGRITANRTMIDLSLPARMTSWVDSYIPALRPCCRNGQNVLVVGLFNKGIDVLNLVLDQNISNCLIPRFGHSWEVTFFPGLARFPHLLRQIWRSQRCSHSLCCVDSFGHLTLGIELGHYHHTSSNMNGRLICRSTHYDGLRHARGIWESVEELCRPCWVVVAFQGACCSLVHRHVHAAGACF
mmetsp:Transcript_29334/g.48641  ORF Transcript_29334/g.48641 Transcript_29334/m.48641 type:complete len:259 (-) Transcript_29334:6-782(-)